MSILPLIVFALVVAGVYLVLQPAMIRIVFGLGLLSHAANVVILASGVSIYRGEPIAGQGPTAEMADPLPQAFVLTAIVISLAVTILMLALSALGHDDDTHHYPDTGQEHR